jgi:excisionase family DNA binding protein
MNDPNQAFQREGLSILEAGAVAGVGRSSIYKAIATGELVARKLGRRRIVLRVDLNNFLAALPIVARSTNENTRG